MVHLVNALMPLLAAYVQTPFQRVQVLSMQQYYLSVDPLVTLFMSRVKTLNGTCQALPSLRNQAALALPQPHATITQALRPQCHSASFPQYPLLPVFSLPCYDVCVDVRHRIVTGIVWVTKV